MSDTPESVRAMAMCMLPPGNIATLYNLRDVAEMLERYAELLKGHEALRSMYADMLERYTELLERLSNQPIEVVGIEEAEEE